MTQQDLLGGHPDEVPLTDEEKRAIATLNRLAGRWPKSLWLFSASGTLTVMRKGDDGDHVSDGDGVAQSHIVTAIAIENDGGDW